MKINFEKEILDVEGKAMADQVDFKQCPNCGFREGVKVEFGKLTLKAAAVRVLGSNFADEPGLDQVEKLRRGLLAIRIHSNPKEIDLESEEIATIKKLINKLYNPIVVVRAFAMLEGKDGPNA